MEEGVLTKKQTISPFKIIVNQAFVTCYLLNQFEKFQLMLTTIRQN